MEYLNFTNLVRYMHDRYGKKESGKPINMSDVQGYVRRKQIPEYFGGNTINTIMISGVKFYKIQEKEVMDGEK